MAIFSFVWGSGDFSFFIKSSKAFFVAKTFWFQVKFCGCFVQNEDLKIFSFQVKFVIFLRFRVKCVKNREFCAGASNISKKNSWCVHRVQSKKKVWEKVGRVTTNHFYTSALTTYTNCQFRSAVVAFKPYTHLQFCRFASAPHTMSAAISLSFSSIVHVFVYCHSAHICVFVQSSYCVIAIATCCCCLFCRDIHVFVADFFLQSFAENCPFSTFSIINMDFCPCEHFYFCNHAKRETLIEIEIKQADSLNFLSAWNVSLFIVSNGRRNESKQHKTIDRCATFGQKHNLNTITKRMLSYT